MVSIIVSSYNQTYFEQFKKNVEQTIGVAYEIIQINNPGLMGICEAYNKGAQQAQYPYLCFSHEDLLFQASNWGEKLIEQFDTNKNIGLVGVAGSLYKPYVPSGWGSIWGGDVAYMNVDQGNKNETQSKLIRLNYGKVTHDIVCVDGCFMFTTKQVYDKVKFDQDVFTNYHFYDIDFSLRVSELCNVAVTFDVPILHFSGGGYDKKWIREAEKFYKKWKMKLPYSKQQLSKDYISSLEQGAFYFLLDNVLKNKKGYSLLTRINFSPKFIKLVGVKEWLFIQVKLPLNFLKPYFLRHKKK